VEVLADPFSDASTDVEGGDAHTDAIGALSVEPLRGPIL
jgi:hypothetical protein